MNPIGSTSNNYQLDAISWKCQETGLSYGKLISQCTDAEILKIYEEYRAMLIARKKGEKPEKPDQRSRASSK